MIKLEPDNIEQAAKDLTGLSRWAPYKYGGKWFVVHIEGQTYAYRTMAPINKRQAALGVYCFDVVTVGK
jgi:hypothetical protein